MNQSDLADLAPAWKEPLADHLEETASWRRAVAHRFPDDERNVNSAQALEAAAEYVRNLDGSHSGLQSFVRFELELADWDERITEDLRTVLASDQAAGQFGFDRGPAPDTRAFDRLLRELYAETLESWRTSIEDGGDQPPASLVSFFDDQGVPLWADEEEDDDGR